MYRIRLRIPREENEASVMIKNVQQRVSSSHAVQEQGTHMRNYHGTRIYEEEEEEEEPRQFYSESVLVCNSWR